MTNFYRRSSPLGKRIRCTSTAKDAFDESWILSKKCGHCWIDHRRSGRDGTKGVSSDFCPLAMSKSTNGRCILVYVWFLAGLKSHFLGCHWGLKVLQRSPQRGSRASIVSLVSCWSDARWRWKMGVLHVLQRGHSDLLVRILQSKQTKHQHGQWDQNQHGRWFRSIWAAVSAAPTSVAAEAQAVAAWWAWCEQPATDDQTRRSSKARIIIVMTTGSINDLSASGAGDKDAAIIMLLCRRLFVSHRLGRRCPRRASGTALASSASHQSAQYSGERAAHRLGLRRRSPGTPRPAQPDDSVRHRHWGKRRRNHPQQATLGSESCARSLYQPQSALQRRQRSAAEQRTPAAVPAPTARQPLGTARWLLGGHPSMPSGSGVIWGSESCAQSESRDPSRSTSALAASGLHGGRTGEQTLALPFQLRLQWEVGHEKLYERRHKCEAWNVRWTPACQDRQPPQDAVFQLIDLADEQKLACGVGSRSQFDAQMVNHRVLPCQHGRGGKVHFAEELASDQCVNARLKRCWIACACQGGRVARHQAKNQAWLKFSCWSSKQNCKACWQFVCHRCGNGKRDNCAPVLSLMSHATSTWFARAPGVLDSNFPSRASDRGYQRKEWTEPNKPLHNQPLDYRKRTERTLCTRSTQTTTAP